MQEFEGIARKHAQKADFYYVYIREAHPSDGWSFGEHNGPEGKWDVKSPESNDERREVAKRWYEDGGAKTVPMLVDDVSDFGLQLYSAHPERLYVLEDGKVTYQGGPGPFNYLTEELSDFLSERFSAGRT